MQEEPLCPRGGCLTGIITNAYNIEIDMISHLLFKLVFNGLNGGKVRLIPQFSRCCSIGTIYIVLHCTPYMGVAVKRNAMFSGRA